MFRKILMSALIVGALAATVGAGSYAAWDDTATGTGTITAANIDVTINGVDAATITFAPQNLLPNETSTSTFNINNNSTRQVNVSHTVAVASDHPATCGSGWLVQDVWNAPSSITANTSAPATLTMKLAWNAPESCMGNKFTVTVTVTGTGV